MKWQAHVMTGYHSPLYQVPVEGVGGYGSLDAQTSLGPWGGRWEVKFLAPQRGSAPGFDLEQTSLYFSRQSELHGANFTPGIGVMAPLGRSAEGTSFQGAILLGVSSSFRIENTQRLQLKPSLQFLKYQHTYKSDALGNINPSYGGLQSLQIQYKLQDKLNLAIAFSHIDIMNYEGTRSEFLSHQETLNWFPLSSSDGLTVSLGHKWGRPSVSAFAEDGKSWNLRVQDEVNSYVFAEVQWRLWQVEGM